MDMSAHAAAVLGYFPFIAALPAGVAVICNHLAAAKRHPILVYASCSVMALCVAFLLSRPTNSVFRGVDLGIAGVLAALCFIWPCLRATNVVTRSAAVLLWREVFLLGFGVFNLYFAWVDWKSWGYIVLAVLCTASAVLLWRSSPLSKYPLYAVTALLAGSALVGGVYNYVHDPAVRQGTLEFHIISWLIPGVPSVLLINCCLYARRVARRGRRMGNSQGKS
jgi:hypothetical protein